MAYFWGIDTLFCIVFVSNLICYPNNHPKQCQQQQAQKAGQGRAGPGVLEDTRRALGGTGREGTGDQSLKQYPHPHCLASMDELSRPDADGAARELCATLT